MSQLLTPTESVPASGPARGAARRSAVYLALLALPFAACLVFLWSTGRSFTVFWDNDEQDYWALMQWFAARLPGLDPIYPHSATTPLFQWLGAWAVAGVGPNIQFVRALNALASFGGVVALFATLRRPFRFGPATAALLTATVAFSAYFFGYSFRLLTDNLALTFCLLALRELFLSLDPAEAASRRHFLLGCVWCTATILTRQSFLFLGLPFLAGLALAPRPLRQKAVDGLALGCVVVPFALLVLAWKGLVPPDYQVRHTASLFHLYALSLPLLLLGFYAPIFFAVPAWRRFRAGDLPLARLRWPALAAGLALAVLVFFPLFPVAGAAGPAYFSPAFRASPAAYAGGWIYTVGQRLPALRGNSLWFWLLLPLGAACAVEFGAAAWRDRDVFRRVAVVFLLGMLGSCTVNAVLAQKYYDALVLLFLIWFSRGDLAGDRWRRLPLFGLLAFFGLYYLVFPLLAKPRPVPPSVPPLAFAHLSP